MVIEVNISYKVILIFIVMSNTMHVESGHNKKSEMIYILLWTHKYMVPFGSAKQKRKSFTVMNCEFQNCYLTEDGAYFDDLTDYDAILFNVIDLRDDLELPMIRSDNQLYIFVSVESPKNFRIPTGGEQFNWYFNYTWTYKLNSDISYPYLIARNRRGEVVAPKKDVHWVDFKEMKPTSQSIKDRMQNKKTAVAWFASNCDAENDRFDYVRNLREALTGYDLEVDIYGNCGNGYCPKDQMDDCLASIERDYYFYLAFENAFSEDYVTEKLLTALDHYAVPVVLGGANYTRFMPDGIYLNANLVGEEEMAKKMNDLIHDKETYYDYFKWHRYYSYHDVTESADTDRVCALCSFLNNMTLRNHRRVYTHISQWWNEDKADNPVFWYENAPHNVKGFVKRYPNKRSTDTPSVLQNIATNTLNVESDHKKIPGLIYILLWTPRDMVPFGAGAPRRKSFTRMNCQFQNCYITGDIGYFDDVTDYDVILFNSIDVKVNMDLPELRSDNQLYLFVSIESASYYEISRDFNWFFNYTWTYKLDSDLTYPYFVAREKRSGKVVAPKTEVLWMDTKEMKPTSQSVKDKLQNKKTAVAWFASNCITINKRLDFVRNLRDVLVNYDLEIDIYGACGNFYCPKDSVDDCYALLERDYYFYLAFENSLSEDYVTEKLFTSLEHFAVPVVYGGANYTRFMPKGIYLDAIALGEEALARKMSEIILDKEKYYDFFRWHSYYSYHSLADSADTDMLCTFCAFLNNMTMRSERRVYARFTDWWNEYEDIPKVKVDPIFYYGKADPDVKGYYTRRQPKFKTLVTPTVLQNIGQFVNQLFSYYFE